MNRALVVLIIMVVMLVAGCGAGQFAKQTGAKEPMLAHNVFFKLNDTSDSAKSALSPLGLLLKSSIGR